MANSISFGKIYSSTWWGNPVKNGWGGIYYGLAIGVLTDRYKTRVGADGGVVESLSCVNDADFISANNWTYYFRVVDDGGLVESLECVKL